MKQTSSRTVRDGLRYIQKYYAYLLERGYEIVSVEEAFLGWQIDLRRADLFVRVLHSRGEDFVSFRTAAQPPDEWTEISGVVYAATGEKIPNSGNDGPELQKYLGRIEAYFAGEHARNPDGLRAAVQAYRDSLPKVEPYIPEEPGEEPLKKKIPILYYPLLGIILLLIFFFLATLCGVLVDRFLAAG